jgi:hypothetical protein
MRQRQALFGAYDYGSDPQPGNPEHVRILGSWEQDNIVDVPIPPFKKTAIGSKAPSSIRFHRLAAANFRDYGRTRRTRSSSIGSFPLLAASSPASCAAPGPRSGRPFFDPRRHAFRGRCPEIVGMA